MELETYRGPVIKDIGRDRLKRLSALLLKDAENSTGIQFDLTSWLATAGGGDRNLLTNDSVNLNGRYPLPKVGAVITERQKMQLEYDLDAGKYGMPEGSCGTSACAVGLAMLDEGFITEGLKTALAVDTEWTGEGYRVKGYIALPQYEGEDNFDAVELFFGIDCATTRYLFQSLHYPADLRTHAEGERYVAARIERLLDGEVEGVYYSYVSNFDEAVEDDE